MAGLRVVLVKGMIPLVVLAALIVVLAGRAAGLSCAALTVEERIARTEVPFIGTLLSQSEEERWAVFRVDESFRVELPETVEVRLSEDSFPRSGSVLAGLNDDGTLGASFGPCYSPPPPELLRSYFRALPEPASTQPAVFLVGTQLGGARVVALDGEGQVVAYGFGAGELGAIAVCPGERTAVEMVLENLGFGRFDVVLEVRDLSTMEVVGTRREVRPNLYVGEVPRPGAIVSGFSCHATDGADVSYLFPWSSGLSGGSLDRPRPEFHRWTGDEAIAVSAEGARSAAVAPGGELAYLLMGPREAQSVSSLDLATFERNDAFTAVPDGGEVAMAVSPTGTHLAVAVGSDDYTRPARLSLIGAASGDTFDVDISPFGRIRAVGWSRGRAAVTRELDSREVSTSFVHPDGWIGEPVESTGFPAHTAVVGEEVLLQLGDESVKAVPIVGEARQAVEGARVYPTVGVAVRSGRDVNEVARQRTSGGQLPVDGFEPLSAGTLAAIAALPAVLPDDAGGTSGAAEPGVEPNGASGVPGPAVILVVVLLAALGLTWLARRTRRIR